MHAHCDNTTNNNDYDNKKLIQSSKKAQRLLPAACDKQTMISFVYTRNRSIRQIDAHYYNHNRQTEKLLA
jgi:ssRNA-specific RNase YbeY (16S rRNA maturation enzyme)